MLLNCRFNCFDHLGKLVFGNQECFDVEDIEEVDLCSDLGKKDMMELVFKSMLAH